MQSRLACLYKLLPCVVTVNLETLLCNAAVLAGNKYARHHHSITDSVKRGGCKTSQSVVLQFCCGMACLTQLPVCGAFKLGP